MIGEGGIKNLGSKQVLHGHPTFLCALASSCQPLTPCTSLDGEIVYLLALAVRNHLQLLCWILRKKTVVFKLLLQYKLSFPSRKGQTTDPARGEGFSCSGRKDNQRC